MGDKRKPLVTFVIPTLNNIGTIEYCLKSIREQDYPRVEIVVADGGSTDGTREVAEELADKVITVKGPLGMARARGAEVAAGEVLGVFDSDVYLPHRGWLSRAIDALVRRPRAAILWPINIPPPNASPVAKAYFALWEYRLRSSRNPLPGGNILVRRRAYEEVGGIDPRLHFGEDYDLTIKILKRGYTYIIYPDPIIHDTMRSLRQYTKKQFWGVRSLKVAPPEIVRTTLSWNPEGRERGLVAAGKHLLAYLRAIPLGVRRYGDLSLALYLPLMMVIRALVYGASYITNRELRKL